MVRVKRKATFKQLAQKRTHFYSKVILTCLSKIISGIINASVCNAMFNISTSNMTEKMNSLLLAGSSEVNLSLILNLHCSSN